MKTRFLSIFIALWSVTSFAEDLPANYTLTDADYELVGNGKHHNFDIRDGKYESDPLVILQKLNDILDYHFTYANADVITVTFDTWDNVAGTDNWDLYVEDLKFRTADYVLNDTPQGYVDLGTAYTFDICTWNIEHYPKSSQSEEKVVDIILASEIDIFALQEIADDAGQFNSLLQRLGSEYEGFIHNPYTESDPILDMNLAIIYKLDEITLMNTGKEIRELRDIDAFTRIPIEISMRHKSGVEIVLIDIHFKCCNGSENRRRTSSEKVKEYIDNKYKATNKKVVLLGDWNDRIDSDETDLVFANFMDDSDNYKFADSQVSEETKDGPGWANIDHILINKPLFVIYDSPAKKLKPSSFNYDYNAFVSDHFPVWVNLNVELLGVDANYIFKSKLNIYPNPTSGNFIHVDFPNGIETATIIITNTLGQEVFNKDTNSEKIDISEYPKGYYLITLKSDKVNYQGKLVKD